MELHLKAERAQRLSRLVFLPARIAARLVPEPVLRRLDDRLFYAVFQMTRVTNDAYPGTSMQSPETQATPKAP